MDFPQQILSYFALCNFYTLVSVLVLDKLMQVVMLRIMLPLWENVRYGFVLRYAVTFILNMLMKHY